ncbi:hypothetical protein JCM15765_34250 [Paradesulfitobacterium aromaticivorans]
MPLTAKSLGSFPNEMLSILDCALEGVMVADDNCVISYINPAYSRLTGLDPKQEIGRVLHENIPSGPLREAITTGRPVYGRRYQPPGSKAELIVNAAPIFVNGQIVGGVSFCQDISDILLLTKKLAQSTELVNTLTEKLESWGGARYSFDDIVGEAKVLRDAVQIARKAALGSSTVLLLGESGTGKELFAQAIANASERRRKPFFTVNCAAIPENLLESEFFGYEKGAFTGANRRKIGLFEKADGGTVFLDEIGDMSLVLQAKILRVLQEGEITRLGGWQPIKVDVRLISATNRNLARMVEEGKFRQDLYFRLNVVNIMIPPLHERREDIPLLCRHVLNRLNRKLGCHVEGVEEQAIELLISYNWPGNVRELENVLERAINLTEGSVITAENLLLPEQKKGRGITPATHAATRAKDNEERILSLAAQERLAIEQALKQYGTTVEGKTQAARVLGISLATLYKRLKS